MISYGKNEFVNFDDQDLAQLLGEFTASEVEFSDVYIVPRFIEEKNLTQLFLLFILGLFIVSC